MPHLVSWFVRTSPCLHSHITPSSTPSPAPPPINTILLPRFSSRSRSSQPYISLVPPKSLVSHPSSAAANKQASSTMKTESSFLTLFSLPLLLLLAAPSLAADPDMLQDLCVADLNSTMKVNGFECKANVTEDDFSFNGLASPGNTNNTMGSLVTGANVEKVPGLNTLGVSMSRIDFAPGGLNPPHTHPRATEMAFVLYGTLDVGFITTANKLVSKNITKGEVFVFPRGLVHFQKNSGDVPAALISAFSSQLPGTQSLAATLFASSPPVPDHVLTTAFQIGTKEVEKIRSRLAPKTK